jgi:hypothetical protein
VLEPDLQPVTSVDTYASLGRQCRSEIFGSKSVLRLLALSLSLAVASSALLADDGDHDQDHRDHGQSVDAIVGSWIVHVTINTLDPNPDNLPLPIKVAPASGINKPPSAGPIIPEMLNCKPLKVAAEGNSSSETT